MSDEGDRVEKMQSEITALETAIEQRHSFALRVFSCVIDLYSLAVNLHDNMPESRERQRFREGLSILADSVNEAQMMMDSIVTAFGTKASQDG